MTTPNVSPIAHAGASPHAPIVHGPTELRPGFRRAAAANSPRDCGCGWGDLCGAHPFVGLLRCDSHAENVTRHGRSPRPIGAVDAQDDTGKVHGPTIVRTVAARGWDGRIFVSDLLWRDPSYALAEGTQPREWRPMRNDERERLTASTGIDPRDLHPGEWCARIADNHLVWNV